jgi:hypothetical protein
MNELYVSLNDNQESFMIKSSGSYGLGKITKSSKHRLTELAYSETVRVIYHCSQFNPIAEYIIIERKR